MKKVLNLRLLGRLGNGLFQYCHARAYAEKHGHELRFGDWIGRKIFDIPNHPQIQESYAEQISELSLQPEHADKSFEWKGYAQHQDCLIYTRGQVREWLRFKKDIQQRLDDCCIPVGGVVAHRRVGDLIGYGYPVVSKKSYEVAAEQFGFDPWLMVFVTEENPIRCENFCCPEFLPDFYRMMQASVLFRGNSCFSFWAAVIGDAQVFSPNIDGLEGGREHDVKFSPGNHHRFANLAFVTDLHLQP